MIIYLCYKTDWLILGTSVENRSEELCSTGTVLLNNKNWSTKKNCYKIKTNLSNCIYIW